MKAFRRQIEEELRDLWRHVPLSGEKFRMYAAHTYASLRNDFYYTDQDDDALFAWLVSITYDVAAQHDEAFALLAMYGTLEGYQELNVDQRLAKYAVSNGRGEGRTARRWAEKGASLVALEIVKRRLVENSLILDLGLDDDGALNLEVTIKPYAGYDTARTTIDGFTTLVFDTSDELAKPDVHLTVYRVTKLNFDLESANHLPPLNIKVPNWSSHPVIDIQWTGQLRVQVYVKPESSRRFTVHTTTTATSCHILASERFDLEEP